MSKKKIARKTASTKTRRAEPRVTLADVEAKDQAVKKAVEAYQDAAYDCDPNLALAIRVRHQAALLLVAIRDVVAPGPDHGGLDRAVGQVAHVSKRLESMAQDLERSAKAVAS